MNQRKTRVLLMIFFTGLLGAGCSSIKVQTHYDPTADFSQYRTYKWLPQKSMGPSAGMKKLTPAEEQIIAAVERELAAKGLQKIGKGKPDLWITYHTRIRDKIDVTRYGYRYWRHGPRGRVVEVRRYKEGALIIDIIDRRAKQLVWRGWASSVLNNPAQVNQTIDKAVQKILEKFPPQ